MGTAEPRRRRSPYVVALCVVQGLAMTFGLGSVLDFFTSASPGIGVVDALQGGVAAVPLTREASDALADVPTFALVLEVNGRSLAARGPGRRGVVEAVNLLDDHAGSVNTVVVEVPPAGARRTLVLHAQRPDPLAAPFLWLLGGYHLVALAYLAVGWLVWWRRPDDPAAVPLLLFCLVSSIQMGSGIATSELVFDWKLISDAMVPLYGPAAFWLALRFTGHRVGPRLRLLSRILFALALALMGFGVVSSYRMSTGVADGTHLGVAIAASGILLTFCVVALVIVCVRMARRSRPAALRQRARLMGVAAIVSFLPPSVLTIVPPESSVSIASGVTTMLCLASFPLMLGWAIVRHRLFDIRVVLGKGLVFLLVSAVVSLVYVGLVLGAVKVFGSVVTESPAIIGLGLAGSIVSFTLLQLRVQSYVDHRIHLTRYLYADAVETASEAIARSHTVEDAIETARSALMGAMRLSRAWVASREGTAGAPLLRCITLQPGAEERPASSVVPLPESLDPTDHPPIAAALEARRWVSAYDAELTLDEHSGPSFFEKHGIEAIVPFGGARSTERRAGADATGQSPAPGALIVGHKRDGRPLDEEDLALLHTVANQLAVGLENARALAEIRRLKDGLEELVEERTRELRRALDDLQTTQGQLVESEKQAMLGRLVAGIVHEINTPLGVVMSSSDTLQRSLRQAIERLEKGAADPDTIERVRRMLDASAGVAALQSTGSRRISEVVASLKQFVSLDRAAVQAVDVRPGLDSAVSLVAGQVEGRIRIERVYPEQLPTVECAPERLNQVWLHLLQNAIAAIDGEGRIEILVGSGDGSVEVTVRDTGRGIAAEALPRVFDFGFARKDGRMGLSLGLPTSRQTIVSLGGDISIESELGRGTTVRVRLPAK
ncbi:MAG: hypothetical protein IT379_02600 [Deltaproteobacteria bacterium]|nr:hypothetical protein [Deltaproteobacteria bacterium]